MRHKTTTSLIDTANKAGFVFLDLELNKRPNDSTSFKIVQQNFDTEMRLEKEFPVGHVSYGDLDEFGSQIILPNNLKSVIGNDVGMSGDFQFLNR